ncbi:GL25003 [Drosophila persimilis]|uniref:Spermine synthase isoform X2 n=2 Tax=pseudoobscura subgroup TaxID=32358 RepID=Q2M0R0_DROPS|nr:spermine synthase isoform X2 [Drosophila pseudoobscura]XP_002021112.1 spermine synthase isoform X2 [Drosophila persimilis]EDW40268.1 GL25003 [Drosophila persimilis]
MAAQTILFDFTLDSAKTADEKQRQEVAKILRNELEHVFPQLELAYSMESPENGYFSVLHENKATIITCRIFQHGLLTVNVEYFLPAGKEPIMSFDTMRTMELILRQKLDSDRSKYLPPIKRGGYIDIYMTSSDERIIEYDIDKLVYEVRSPFQKIQILHSKTLGNMLLLDELQNIAESDLIYTETLMGRGIENYEGKEICILGGGDGALLYELLKENPKHVVMLEIDELVMEACNKYLNSICGDVLEKRRSDQYEIVVGDCVEYLKKFIGEGRKFDYVFGDLTDIPITGAPVGVDWDFIRTIFEHSFKVLKPDGKFLTHGNGTSCTESLELFEEQLSLLKPKVKFTTSKAFVPSFMEEWLFYQVSFA